MLSAKHEMIPLYIQRETLFRSFENQVLITKDIQTSRRLLIIVHDPYETLPLLSDGGVPMLTIVQARAARAARPSGQLARSP